MYMYIVIGGMYNFCGKSGLLGKMFAYFSLKNNIFQLFASILFLAGLPVSKDFTWRIRLVFWL